MILFLKKGKIYEEKRSAYYVYVWSVQDKDVHTLVQGHVKINISKQLEMNV